MPVAIRAATRIQDMDDANVSLAVGVDEYALVYDHDTAKFVLRAPFDGTPYALLAGRAGGQTLYGGTAANDDITIHGTSDATRATSYVLLQPTAGNVGIGTTAPGAKLVVSDNSGRAPSLTAGATASFIVNAASIELAQGSDSSAPSEYWMQARTGGVAWNLSINPLGGNVGIGTTSPATALHVVGAATITGGIRPAADSTTALQLQNAAGVSVLNVDTTNARVGIGTTAPGAPLHVVGNGTYAAAFMSGFVGHGTTAPEAPLHIVNNATIADGVKMYNGGTLTAGINIYNGNVLTYGFYIANEQKNYFSSKLGIGTDSPATRLDIDAGALTMAEMTAPTGVANKAMLYAKDNGSGKTQICCKLGDDVEIVMFTQA